MTGFTIVVTNPADGSIGVRVSDGPNGRVTNRYVLAPGIFVAAETWEDADLSAQPADVQAAATSAWTPEIVAAWQAAHPWVEPDSAVTPSTPTVACLANLDIADGDVAGVEDGATGLAFAFAIAPDVFWLYFTDELPDSNYNPNVNATSGVARVTDRQTDHLEITVEGATEPYSIFVQVFRTI